ncbi:phthiocerol/phthiodiolone dimycocerosyl transferase family protein [Nocardia callitridis]|uniref:Phthiocerol/phthiodiolone dimycocerosyl transferase n=1 Tax=Nocardia callitridis TaxID=648753 RepID=A0ABP9KUU9_9NOCA
MSTITVIRPLAPSEEIFASSQVLVGYCTRVLGRVDLPALTRAFAALHQAYPLLAAGLLEDTDGRHILVESPGPAPVVDIREGDPDQLLVGARLDQRTALAALCVVRAVDNPEDASVTLVTHHAIADAAHSVALVGQLWACYTELTEGRPGNIAPQPYPGTVEQLLDTRGVAKSGDPTRRVRAAGPLVAPEVSDDTPYVLPRTARCRLTRSQTAALVELGHRRHTTMNGLASAAILLTEAELRGLPLHELNYTYSVDLRTRVTPPIGATEGTNVLGFADFAPTTHTGANPVELARAISDTLYDELGAGLVQQSPLHIPDITAGPPPASPGVVLTTNWGRVTAPPVPPALRVTDFRSIMIGKPDKTGHRLQQPSGTIIISTFDDRLSIEIHHPVETTEEQRLRVGLLMTHLCAAPRR